MYLKNSIVIVGFAVTSRSGYSYGNGKVKAGLDDVKTISS